MVMVMVMSVTFIFVLLKAGLGAGLSRSLSSLTIVIIITKITPHHHHHHQQQHYLSSLYHHIWSFTKISSPYDNFFFDQQHLCHQDNDIDQREPGRAAGLAHPCLLFVTNLENLDLWSISLHSFLSFSDHFPVADQHLVLLILTISNTISLQVLSRLETQPIPSWDSQSFPMFRNATHPNVYPLLHFSFPVHWFQKQGPP